jgi:cobalt transporter subunit CbtA
MFGRILFAAVLAGLLAGLAMSVIQIGRTSALILEAETYEVAAADIDTAPAAEATPAADTGSQPFSPAAGFERNALTVLSNMLLGAGLALALAGVSTLANVPVTTANGLLWGLFGFIAITLAPAFGLPPELPGKIAAELGQRQTWWWATVLVTAAAFLAVARFKTPIVLIIAAIAVLVPHIIGAPPPPVPDGVVGPPAGLAADFVVATLLQMLILWLVAGYGYGWFLERFTADSGARDEAMAKERSHGAG